MQGRRPLAPMLLPVHADAVGLPRLKFAGLTNHAVGDGTTRSWRPAPPALIACWRARACRSTGNAGAAKASALLSAAALGNFRAIDGPVDFARQQRGHHCVASLVRHVRGLEAGRMNCTAARCGGAPLTRGAEIPRALFGLGTFQQFTHGLRRRRRGHSEKQRADAEARHRSEVAQRVLAGAGD